MPLDDVIGEAMAQGMAAGLVLDGTLATSEAQRMGLWRLREEQPEGQRREGPQLKHDIAVPPGRLAEFIELAENACESCLPGVRVNPFGHLGDGNIHYNLTPPEGAAGFGDAAPDLALALGRLAQRTEGSFAAEHGLGQARIALADALRDPVERGMMAALKGALDPAGTMNLGVIVTANRKDRIS